MFERHVLTFIILFLSNASLLVDSLRGSVIDRNTHEPVIGATISLGTAKSNKILAVTDANGNFQINIGEYPAKLIVSYVGYNSEEYAVAQHTNQNIDISLTESTKALNEVVVVGYGTQSRTQLTGAVTTIKADALAASVAPTIDAALVGKVAGLNVTPAYAIINLSAQYRLKVQKVSSLILRAGVENLLDKRYTTYSDWNNIPQKGRNIYLSLSLGL